MNLDWKWVGIGAAIMIVLGIIAGIIVGVILAGELEGVTDPAQITFTGGQVAMIAAANFFCFLIGGFIVGVKSAGRTILEPAIAAAIAAAIALLLSGNFSIGGFLAGALVPFLAGLLGGWLGEKRQDAKASPS